MIDINNGSVDIRIRKDGKVVWVNIGGVCMLRCSDIKNDVVIIDERPTLDATSDLIEALSTLVNKCVIVVEGFSFESFPSNYTSVLNDNLLCIKQAVDDATIALTKAGVNS